MEELKWSGTGGWGMGIHCVHYIEEKDCTQRIYTSDRRVSPPPPFVVRRKHSPNLSLPALSAVMQTDRYCKILQTERREVG